PAGAEVIAAFSLLAADLSPDDADARLVVVHSAVFVLGCPRFALALGRVGDDLHAVRHRSLRRQDWQVSGHGAGQMGLLHGSPARLLFPVFRDHWLRLHPSRTLSASGSDSPR